MLDRRHSAEGMSREMRLALDAGRRQRRQPVIDAFLLERGEDRTGIRAAGNGIDNKLRHDVFPHMLALA
jgi:hypothetical protein